MCRLIPVIVALWEAEAGKFHFGLCSETLIKQQQQKIPISWVT